MDAMMKECMKPHALMHLLSGIGLGIIIAAVMGSTNMGLGVVLLIAGMLGDMWVQQKK